MSIRWDSHDNGSHEGVHGNYGHGLKRGAEDSYRKFYQPALKLNKLILSLDMKKVPILRKKRKMKKKLKRMRSHTLKDEDVRLWRMRMCGRDMLRKTRNPQQIHQCRRAVQDVWPQNQQPCRKQTWSRWWRTFWGSSSGGRQQNDRWSAHSALKSGQVSNAKWHQPNPI